MKNYNDPMTWMMFLQRNAIESDAPPPPPTLVRDLDKDKRHDALCAWAMRQDPEQKRRVVTRRPRLRRSQPLTLLFT